MTTAIYNHSAERPRYRLLNVREPFQTGWGVFRRTTADKSYRDEVKYSLCWFITGHFRDQTLIQSAAGVWWQKNGGEAAVCVGFETNTLICGINTDAKSSLFLFPPKIRIWNLKRQKHHRNYHKFLSNDSDVSCDKTSIGENNSWKCVCYLVHGGAIVDLQDGAFLSARACD